MLYRDEVQSRRLNVEVKGESLVLRTACSPWLVEELETDRGLRVFSRQPSREHQRLLDIARRPENILSLASTPSGVIVGQVTLAPLHGWSGDLTNAYEIACEVSSAFRRKGIARHLLTLVLETEGIEDLILLGFGLSWHWDTIGLGLTCANYRSMLTTFLASYGFFDCPTTEGNIVLDPCNVLFARIGTRVSPEMTIQFYNSLYLQ
ncbi:MAG TPA: GNAT family N-acetyltransferase [Ktedonobacteraceae bacterium]|jgi:GNAT superfamily N-acetyltransferase|nr:GNAT family N-acetyltransferase [Ktedonobacteraceae bacterium]